MFLVGTGPSPIEDIFAVRVCFQIKRHGAGKRLFVTHDQILRRPSRRGAGAAGFMQRVQKFVAQQRMAVRQRIPFGGRE